MNNIWFTSDEHFNHANVIKHMNRPFASMEEMNEALIANHNELVKPGDRVYHLGDFAWTSPEKFAARLNGNHYLIKGNHDRQDKIEGFIWIKSSCNLKDNGWKIHLSHYAHRVWNCSHHGAFHLYGHSHGMLEGYGRSMDVGVDAWDYRPVSIDQVVESLSKIQLFSNHHPEQEI